MTTYVPRQSDDWDRHHGRVDSALDELAGRVKTNETTLSRPQTPDRVAYWSDTTTASSSGIILSGTARDSLTADEANFGGRVVAGVNALDIDDLTFATGLIVSTGAGAVTQRTISATNGITITNGNGVAANPTIGTRIAGTASLEYSSGAIQFVNDATTATRKYYGSNDSGTKGYHDLPSEDRPYLFVHTVNDSTSWTSATTYNFDYGNVAASSYGLPGIPYDCRLLGLIYKGNPVGSMTTQTFDINVVASRESGGGSTIKTQTFGVSGGGRHIETHMYDWSDNLAFTQGETMHVTANNHTGTWNGSNYMRRHALTAVFGIAPSDMPLLSS